jgi:DNA polymerase (family X)
VDNRAVAAVFLEMAELLQIQGGDTHRSRAFRRTAQIIEGMREPVAEQLKHGRLARVPGIGPGSVERVKAILETGTCGEHQRLTSRLPKGLRDVLHVRGMGPRHARLVFETLGVATLEDLERVARGGLLARVPGIGQKTVERVLAHLDDMKAGPAPRLRLDQALEVGARLVGWMREDPACILVEQTGSARRHKETVGDLDVLVGSRQPAAASRRFTSFPGTREILLAGEGRATILLEDGVQVDLRVVAPETFGAGLHSFTGSRQHNIQMRLRANQLRMHLSEHGVWERRLHGRGQGEANRKIARRVVGGRTEEEVFAAVGLPFIAPELREGEGEIEAAVAGRLPRLVEANDLEGDLHLRPRSLAEASAMLHAARAAGLSYVGIVREPGALDDDFARECRLLEASVGVRVFLATLAPIAPDGTVELDEDARARADLVFGRVMDARGQGREQLTARIVTAIASGAIDVLCRPLGRTLLEDPGLDLEIWDVLKAAARHRVLVEVGGHPAHLDLDARSCRTNLAAGALLSIASEAVAPEEMAPRLRGALGQARRGWTGRELVANAMPLRALEGLFFARRPAGARSRARGPAPGAELQEWIAEDPLAAALARAPLAPELLERLERFLLGEADAALERALTRAAGNALQRAFELVARARAAP